MRRVSLFESAWEEYLVACRRFLPEHLRKRLFTRKAVLVLLVVLLVDLALIGWAVTAWRDGH